jgi:hypothetical protein
MTPSGMAAIWLAIGYIGMEAGIPAWLWAAYTGFGCGWLVCAAVEWVQGREP